MNMNISIKEQDRKLLEKVSEVDRRSLSNTLVIALEEYAKKLGVDKNV